MIQTFLGAGLISSVPNQMQYTHLELADVTTEQFLEVYEHELWPAVATGLVAAWLDPRGWSFSNAPVNIALYVHDASDEQVLNMSVTRTVNSRSEIGGPYSGCIFLPIAEMIGHPTPFMPMAGCWFELSVTFPADGVTADGDPPLLAALWTPFRSNDLDFGDNPG